MASVLTQALRVVAVVVAGGRGVFGVLLVSREPVDSACIRVIVGLVG